MRSRIPTLELLVDDRDGQHYFYDINALSNFVADAPRVVGFDPWVGFVDYIVARADGAARESGGGVGSGTTRANLATVAE